MKIPKGVLMRVNLWKLIIGSILFVGCSTKLVISTEPTEVDVTLKLPNGEKKPLGKTPTEVTLSDLEKDLPLTASTGEMLELQFEKTDFESQRIWIPPAKFGMTTVNVFTKLKSGTDQAKLADSLLQYLHNAQKFAANGNFERAIQEVDIALEKNPRFVRGLSMKGAILFNQGKWDDSRKWYEKALNIDNSFDEAVKMIDQIKKKKGELP